MMFGTYETCGETEMLIFNGFVRLSKEETSGSKDKISGGIEM